MNVSRLCLSTLRNARPPFFSNKLRLNGRTVSSFNQKQQQIATVETPIYQKEESLVKKIVKKIPFLNFQKTKIMASAYFHYENIADKVDYIQFFEELDLPDTFYSWFVVTELHIWMLSVRGMAEGDDGRVFRNHLVEALWNDVGQRIKQLGGDTNPAAAREQVAQLSEQLQAALIAYDEGLQGDDTILAGALWRRLYQKKEVEVEYLSILVRYIRKQVRLLDHTPGDIFFEQKDINWIDLIK